MSKWVAKRDDVMANGHGNGVGLDRINGKGMGKDAGAAARQAGEVRRLIRLAAQEARGDPRRKPQSEEINGFKSGPVGPPVGSSSLAASEAWDGEYDGYDGYDYEGYWNDWSSSWSEWGSSWQSRDWKTSKGTSKGYSKGTPWNYAESKEAWQEWDWEEDLWDEASEWDEYITIKDSTVRVELSGAELGDADLKELMQYLDDYMQRYEDENGGHYAMNIDLSCNSYVTDSGVASHLVPFLQKWPICQRLKLYKNALGDPTIKALSSWVADGYAHELHLSDLSGKVSSEAVLNLLKEIHRKQNYPCSNGKGKCPLWLRLEHNGISDVDGLMEKAQSLGISVTLVDKADLARVRPGSVKGKDPSTAINLVMFRPHERRRGKGHAHQEEYDNEDTTDGHSRPTSPPDAKRSKGHEDEEESYKDKKGKGNGKDLSKSGRQAVKPLTASDLQMGAASYRTQMSKGQAGPPSQPPQASKAQAKHGKIDIGSAAAFPSLGGPSEKPDVANWGPNLQAAVAWGSAPTTVFAAPKKPEKPSLESPVLGPVPKDLAVQEMKETKPEKTGPNVGKLPGPVGAAVPSEAPQRPPPIGADVRSLKGFQGLPPHLGAAAREIMGAIGAPFPRPVSPGIDPKAEKAESHNRSQPTQPKQPPPSSAPSAPSQPQSVPQPVQLAQQLQPGPVQPPTTAPSAPPAVVPPSAAPAAPPAPSKPPEAPAGTVQPEVRSMQAPPTAPPSGPPAPIEATKAKPVAVGAPSMPPATAPVLPPPDRSASAPKVSPPTEPPSALEQVRRLPNAPSKPAPTAPTAAPTAAPTVAPTAAPTTAPTLNAPTPTAPPSMPPEMQSAQTAPRTQQGQPSQPTAPPSQAPRPVAQAPQAPPPKVPPQAVSQPTQPAVQQSEQGQKKVVEEDFASIYEVPPDIVWKPLSYAEKNILKARKKIREVEKIEEAYAVKGKLEPGQLAKVQRKPELEQELRVYEQRSHAQGGRNLHELEKAEHWRKAHERYEHAATSIQKVLRRCFVKKQLPELRKAAMARQAERNFAAKQIQKVIRAYQSQQAQKATLRKLELASQEAEEANVGSPPDIPVEARPVPESWDADTFSAKVKQLPAPPAPPAPAPAGFGFRLPPPGTVTRKDAGQANSSWEAGEVEDPYQANPAARFLQRIGHDWQEPQEQALEPVLNEDSWNDSGYEVSAVVDEPPRTAETTNLANGANGAKGHAEARDTRDSEHVVSHEPDEKKPSHVAHVEEVPEAEVQRQEPVASPAEVAMPSTGSSAQVERAEERKEETQIVKPVGATAEGSALSKFLKRIGTAQADAPERRTEPQANEPPKPDASPALQPVQPTVQPAAQPVQPLEAQASQASQAAPSQPAQTVSPALHPRISPPAQVAGFSKFFQRITGNITVQEDHKEVIEKEVVQEAKSQESKEAPKPAEEAKSEDENDSEKVQEVHKIDHKYVGLVIGKEGSTIKSFIKQSGASIEVDQTLPPGMPRMVIYRGTKKQVTTARKLVDGLVLRARDDEKAATGGRDKDTEKGPQDGRDLPLWRRGKPGEDEKVPVAERRPRKEWNKPKEIEAAPSGSLTGLTSASMRPAWMRPKEQEEKFQDKCVWSEQKYSRGLLLQAKQKILKMKAYEVPEEMMTMTTGPRPKNRKEKDGDDHHEDEEERKERKRKAKEAKEAERAARALAETQAPELHEVKGSDAKLTAEAKPAPSAVRTSSYENLPGDSKEMLKLKKKLREIQKIEDSMAAGESVEPLQAEKVNKKEAYLEELHFLESIVNEGDLET